MDVLKWIVFGSLDLLLTWVVIDYFYSCLFKPESIPHEVHTRETSSTERLKLYGYYALLFVSLTVWLSFSIRGLLSWMPSDWRVWQDGESIWQAENLGFVIGVPLALLLMFSLYHAGADRLKLQEQLRQFIQERDARPEAKGPADNAASQDDGA